MKNRYITNQNISSTKGRLVREIGHGTTYKVLRIGFTFVEVTRNGGLVEYVTKSVFKKNFILLGDD